MAVCSIGVSDTNSIPENVFSSAFKIFDQVKLALFNEMKNSCNQDEDDRLSLPETRIILSIFLPIRVQQEQVWTNQPDLWLLNQELVETILYSMDRQKDGYIRLNDLVAGLRSSTSFSLSMYREEFILVGLMVAGFLLYQVICFWIPIKRMLYLPGGKAVRSCAGHRSLRRPYRNMICQSIQAVRDAQ